MNSESQKWERQTEMLLASSRAVEGGGERKRKKRTVLLNKGGASMCGVCVCEKREKEGARWDHGIKTEEE